MWQHIVTIAQTAAAFLTNGKAPPNTPPEYEKQMEQTNHLASKKFFIIMTSLLIIVTMFFIAVGILFVIPKDHDIVITTYATIFTKIMEQIALVISVYLGAQGLVDLKYNSSSSVSVSGDAQSVDQTLNSNSNEQKAENIIEEILTNNAKEQDYNITEL
jgi:succinate dehydrogenase hydrophobic anchor subunit